MWRDALDYSSLKMRPTVAPIVGKAPGKLAPMTSGIEMKKKKKAASMPRPNPTTGY